MALARRGARVAFTYSQERARTRRTRGRRIAGAGRGAARLPGLGRRRRARATKTVDGVVAAWGGVDVLVNNAGINQILPIALIEEADWDAVMDVNVKGAFLFSRAVAEGR